MGRAQFEYDEVGNTFYYVIVSFFAVVLFPLTAYLWPSLPKKLTVKTVGCNCEGDLRKQRKKEAVQPWERTKCVIKAVVLLVLWALFITLVYKVSQIKSEHVEYDPYKILGIDQEAEVSEIKKRYRELTKTHHPDKGGDAEAFDNIVKAYKALTDDESRENWRLYGNPDGPKATTFGIALPKWIVSEQYGIWVLACYGLIFMVLLPLAVGFWWYNSIKYSADKILLDTGHLYSHFLHKTPSMEINRIIMVLAGSCEFSTKYNRDVVQRPTDEVEMPRLMKELRNLGEKKREWPLCHGYSIKARALIHAYLSRIETGSEALDSDQAYIIGRLLGLLDEYVHVIMQMIFQIAMQRPPTVETMENSLRLFPMIVQALWPRNSTLLQLPHISEHNVPFLRKNRVVTCQDLANLSESKRRRLLNTISDEQYEDVVHVLSMMPRLNVSTKIEVQGEDDRETVTIGSVVTLKVTLRRSPLLDLAQRGDEIDRDALVAQSAAQDELADEDDDEKSNQPKRKVWEKQPKKKPKKGKSGGGKAPTKKKPAAAGTTTTTTTLAALAGDASQTSTAPGTPKEATKRKKRDADEESDGEEAADSETDAGSESESDDGGDADGDRASQNEDYADDDDDERDEEIWKEHEQLMKKETLLDHEPVNHHEVHCPYYPVEKFEWWYIYLVERKNRRLVSLVLPCKTLNVEKTIDLRFSAPSQKGVHYFTLNVRSDSYMDSDYTVDVKMDVHEAREPPQVKYEDTEDEGEEEKAALSESSDNYTEGSDSEIED